MRSTINKLMPNSRANKEKQARTREKFEAMEDKLTTDLNLEKIKKDDRILQKVKERIEHEAIEERNQEVVLHERGMRQLYRCVGDSITGRIEMTDEDQEILGDLEGYEATDSPGSL